MNTDNIIQALLTETKKEFKDDKLVIADDAQFISNLNFLSSGNYVVNYKLTGNPFKAYPFGRIISFEGPSDSGKSLFASHAIKEIQKINGIAVLFDVERGAVNSRLKNLNIDTSKLLVSKDKILERIRHIKPIMYVVLWIAWRLSPEYHRYRYWWSIWNEYKGSL